MDSIDYNKVLSYTLLILKDFPFYIQGILYTGVAYYKLGNNELATLWLRKYKGLIKTIRTSGDGKESSSAYIVTNTSDEYALLNDLELTFTQQFLITEKEKWYDLMEVEKNKSSIDKVYFDINLFFGKFQ